MTTFLLLIACGIVGGLLFFFLHIPGGAMLGAVVAVLAVKMLGHVETDTPHLFQLGAQIAIGVMVGNMMTGGLQAVVGMASDLGTNAPAVLAFHLVRLYTVLLLAPFLSWLLHRLLPNS